mmetsp:Transcript_42326/g.122425  ORF Transcript_42326/g.122425 Transcript_42326/m.122425 type:complete len:390 (+) Transcript_42326:288-1457(+)
MHPTDKHTRWPSAALKWWIVPNNPKSALPPACAVTSIPAEARCTAKPAPRRLERPGFQPMLTTLPDSRTMILFCASRLSRPALNSSSLKAGSPSARPSFTLISKSPLGTSCCACRARLRATSVVSTASLPEVMRIEPSSTSAAPAPAGSSSRDRFWPRPGSPPSAGGGASPPSPALPPASIAGASSSRAARRSLWASSTSSSSTSSLRSRSFACAVASRMIASRVRVVTASLGFLDSAAPTSPWPLLKRMRMSTYFSATCADAPGLSTGVKRLQYRRYLRRKSTVRTSGAASPSGPGSVFSKTSVASCARRASASCLRSRMLECICSTPRRRPPPTWRICACRSTCVAILRSISSVVRSRTTYTRSKRESRESGKPMFLARSSAGSKFP